MLKTILKVVYVTIAAVLCFILFMGFYNTFRSDYVIELTSTAVKEKNYETIAKVFNVTFDLKSVLNEQPTDEVHIEILPSISRVDAVTYKKEEGSEDYTATTNYLFEYNYSFYLYEPKFSTADSSDNGIYTNKTAIRFYGENDKYYDYLLKVTSSVNKDSYSARPETVSDALLKSSRDQLQVLNLINATYATINESIINYIQSEYLESSITGYSIIDGNGKEVFAPQNVNFDFSQQFFNEQEIIDFKTKYNEVIEAQKESTDAANSKYADFEKWYYGENNDGIFYTFYESEAHPTYMHQLDESELKPASIVWKTIGIIALFLLAVIILYILLFYFKWIKRIVTRSGKNEGRYTAKNQAQKKNSNNNSNKAQANSLKNKPNKSTKPTKAIDTKVNSNINAKVESNTQANNQVETSTINEVKEDGVVNNEAPKDLDINNNSTSDTTESK